MGCGCNYSGGGYNNAAGSDAQVIKEGTPGVVGSREATFSEGMVVTSTRRGPGGGIVVVGYPAQSMSTGAPSGPGNPTFPPSEPNGRTPFNTPGLGWGKTTAPTGGGRTPFNTPGLGWGRTAQSGDMRGLPGMTGRRGPGDGYNLGWRSEPTGGGSDRSAPPLCVGGNHKFDQYGRACPGFYPTDDERAAGIPGPYRPADFRNASGSAARGRTPFNTPGGWGRTTVPTNDMRGLPGMTGRRGPGDGYNFGWRSAPTGGGAVGRRGPGDGYNFGWRSAPTGKGAVGRRGPGDGYNFGWRSAPTTEGMDNINRERRGQPYVFGWNRPPVGGQGRTTAQPYVFGWNRPPKAENFAQRLKGKYGKGFSG